MTVGEEGEGNPLPEVTFQMFGPYSDSFSGSSGYNYALAYAHDKAPFENATLDEFNEFVDQNVPAKEDASEATVVFDDGTWHENGGVQKSSFSFTDDSDADGSNGNTGNANSVTDGDELIDDTSSSDYIFPDSSTERLSKADLDGYTDDELCLGMNEIWARHGRKFKNKWLQRYFNKQSWYNGTIPADQFLKRYKPTKTENKNAELINGVLLDHGYVLNKRHPND